MAIQRADQDERDRIRKDADSRHPQSPPTPRKVGMPLSALTPAPARMKTRSVDVTRSMDERLIPSAHADEIAPLLRHHEFPRSIFGGATLAPQQGVPERFPNLVEGNGVRGHPVSALPGVLTQQRLLAPLPSLGGLCERKGDLWPS
jgi:hypothetical protein